MLSGNLKKLRKSKGLSQEELAVKLNVVRQTVSKWEKGLSVPDCEMLIKIAEAFDVSVSDLLCENNQSKEQNTIDTIAAKLELLNEQFAKKNEQKRKIWHVFFIAVCIVAVVGVAMELIVYFYTENLGFLSDASIGIIGGADGPTSIIVTNSDFGILPAIFTFVLIIISIVGIIKTKKS